MRLAFAVASALLLACDVSTSPAASDPPPPTEPPTTANEPSAGCSQWTLARGVSTGRIDVAGVARTFVLSVPQGAGPFPVVFAFHGMGSKGSDFRSWLGRLAFESSAAGPTIFVYPDALPVGGTGDTGWDDANGRDVAFFDGLLQKIEAEACVNESRVFSMGFSYGGFMSTNLGCKRAGVLRGIAPLSGGGPWGSCNGRKVAAWLATGDKDELIQQSLASRDRFVSIDACGSSTSAVPPSPCVAYSGCAAGFPVVWCPFTGIHEVQSWEPPAVMKFFDGLP